MLLQDFRLDLFLSNLVGSCFDSSNLRPCLRHCLPAFIHPLRERHWCVHVSLEVLDFVRDVYPKSLAAEVQPKDGQFPLGLRKFQRPCGIRVPGQSLSCRKAQVHQVPIDAFCFLVIRNRRCLKSFHPIIHVTCLKELIFSSKISLQACPISCVDISKLHWWKFRKCCPKQLVAVEVHPHRPMITVHIAERRLVAGRKDCLLDVWSAQDVVDPGPPSDVGAWER